MNKNDPAYRAFLEDGIICERAFKENLSFNEFESWLQKFDYWEIEKRVNSVWIFVHDNMGINVFTGENIYAAFERGIKQFNEKKSGEKKWNDEYSH